MSNDSASEESKGSTLPPLPPPLLSREEILSLKNGGQTQARRSQPTYRPLAEIKTSSVKGLLGYLDFLKPLLLMNNDLITHAMKMFEGLQARVRPPDLPLRIESFELSMSNVRKFFPSEEPSIEHILQLLSFKKPTLGQYVYLLDVLTVLVVIFRAPTDGLREKARWLFDWYNFSKTGTMTEIEHVLLIKRVSDCMVRIKAIGRIDVTEDDANQIALEARVRKTADGQIRFIPGLTFEDFYIWTRDSAECAVLVKFVVVQDRLVDALQALRSRVDSVLSIVDDMRRNREYAIHVPKMDMFFAMQHCAAPLLMSMRTDRSVTVLVAAVAAFDAWASSPTVSEVFVRCCRSRSVPEPLYIIPDSTMQRKQAKGQRAIPSGLPKCCQREYELTSYLRVPLRRVKIVDDGGMPPLLRVDISQLEPESHYEFTVYTPSWSFPPIAATTLPAAEMDQASVTVAVLPGTLSLADTDSFVGSTPLLDTAGAIVHSGTLCPIDSIIRQSLLFADADMRGGADVDALARAMAASSQAVYSITWADAVGRLTGLCSAAAAPAAARLTGLYPHHGRKQALYHNGMGPWGSPQVRAQLADLLGPLQFESVEQRLEREYARFAAFTCPPRPALSVGSVTLVFARCPNFSDRSPEGSDLANISVPELTEELVLQSLGAVGKEEHGEGEDSRPGALGKLRDQLVIVLRSPLDLVDSLLIWAEEPVDSRPSSPALAVAAPTPVAALPARVQLPIDQKDDDELQEPPPGPRLTGRHELIHGEFSSKRALTAAEAALLIAPDFNAGAPPPRSLTSESEAAAQPSRRPLAQLKLNLVTRDPLNSDFDDGFEAFIKALFVWMSFGEERAGRALRQTRLVSTGWSQGINFEIVHRPSGRRVEHVCLLPAISEADLERGGAALALNLRLVSRLRVSLPEDCVFTALSATPLRAVALQAPSAQSGAAPILSFVPINKILDKELPVFGLAPPSEPVKLLDGPRILRLTSTEAHVLVAAVGHGKVRATIFELPFEVNAKIALGLVASERDKLRVVGSMWQRCAKRRHMRFSFTNLLPYCNYCVLVEPVVPTSPRGSGPPGIGDPPRLAQFRTLYNTGSCMNSVVLAAVSEADYALPSAGLSKVTHLFDGPRPPSAPVHLVHHFTRRSLLGIGIAKPHRADLQHLYQRAEVVHTLAAPRPGERIRTAAIRDDRPDLDLLASHSDYDDADLSRIHLSSSGKFSRLAPRDGSEESLVAMVAIIAKLDTHSPATENLLVIVQRPVIRFLQKHDDGKWSNEGIHRTQMALRCLLLEMLLLWKARAPGRDVQIVTFAEVSVMQVATVGFRQPREAYDHAASLGMLDRESITEVALEIMSSSVAYEDKDDDASSIASVEQEQKGEAEGAGDGIMQFGLGWEEEEAKQEFSLSESQELPPGSRGSLGSRGSRAMEGSIDSLEGAGPGMVPLGAQSLEGGSRAGSRADSRQSLDGEGSIVVAELGGGTSGQPELDGSIAASLSSSLDQGDTALLPAEGSVDRPAGKGSSWGFSLTRSPVKQSDKPGSPSAGERPSSTSMFGGGGLLSSLGNKLAKAGAALTSGLDKMMKADDADEKLGPEAEKEPEVELEQPSFVESQADTQSTASHATFYGPNVNLRHIILPIWDGGRQTAGDRALVMFPDGLNMMGDRLECFLNRDTADFGNVNVVQMKQPRELYGNAVNSALEPEASVFLLDLFIRPGEGNTINNSSTPFVDHPEESVVGSVEPNDAGSSVGGPAGDYPGTRPHDLALQQLRLPPEVRARNRKSYQYHYIMSRSFVHHVDFFELLMGPVIGALTTTSARVLFEVNLDLVSLDIVARPLRRQGQPPPPDVKVVGDDEPPIDDCVLTMTNIQAYKVFSCDFEGLSPNRIYQVMIPELWGDKVFGSFRTQKEFTRHTELLIAGYGSFNNNPMMAAMLDQFYSQQMIEYKFLFREQRILYAARIAGLLSGFPFPSLQDSNMWTLVAERLQTPLVETNFVIHLDSQAFLTAFLGQLINVLLEAGRRLFLPLRDASAVEAYYFNQFEEVVRDTFRLVWSVPVLREALAAGAHQPLFHPEYLVSSRAIPPNTLQTAADEKLVAVIRKVFETHFMSYVVRLYNWQPDSGHHARVWKQGPMVVIMLDLVTGRKKLKGKKKDNASEAGGGADGDQSESAAAPKSSPTAKGKKGAAEAAAAAASAIVFSLGFLDKEQWKLIKSVAEDDLVTQVVIVSQQPFLSLSDLPTEPLQPPSEIPKGECLEWRPTLLDMQQFLLFWIEWLQHKPRRPVLSKNVALVSGSNIPYVTTVQDLKTGSKIHQMCVGAFNVDPIGERGAGSHPPSVPSLDEFVLKGKIGRLRYQHRFTELDRVLIDCSREPSRGAHFDPGMDLSPLLRPCYGQLKFYFDSWRASGLWRIVTDSEHRKKDSSDNGALLLVGPILGAPVVTEATADDYLGPDATETDFLFRVGVLIEVDCFATVTFAVEQAFTGEVQHFAFECVANRPITCSIGPLEIANRYNCQIVSGVRQSQCVPFVISTHINWSESNFAFLNCKMADGTLPAEDFAKEVLNRCKVPFSGITAVVHLNSFPDMTPEIEELRRLPFLRASLEHCQKLGHLTADVFYYLDSLMEQVRDLFRRHLARPMYAEVLRNGFTLFMQTYPLFRHYAHIDEDGDDEDETTAVESESEAVLRFLHLVFTRVYQEYFDQVNRPRDNVLRARFKKQSDDEEPMMAVGEITEEQLAAVAAEDKRKQIMIDELSIDAFSVEATLRVEKTNPEAHPVKVVFKQWLREMRPFPPLWQNWLAPNRRAVIELMPAMEPRNYVAVFEKFEGGNEPLDQGVRVIVVDGKRDGSGLDSCLMDEDPDDPDPEMGNGGQKLFRQAYKYKMGGDWAAGVVARGKSARPDREVMFVCPTEKFGTRRIPLQVPKEIEDHADFKAIALERPFSGVWAVDSFYRCNAAERAMKMLEVEERIKKESKAREKAEGGKAKTKKIQAQRAEEERVRIAESQKQLDEVLKSLVPDGYLFIECRTSLMMASGGKADLLSSAQGRIVSSLRMDVSTPNGAVASSDPSPENFALADEDGAPSIVDYLQIPDWLEKFFPSHEGVFVQDDILLYMRQDPDTREVLKQLEGDEVVVKGVELYERSRLSELSRPPDLREVDMDGPGVVSLFLKDLVDRYWEEAVADDIKPFLVPIRDDFLRAFILSRALPEPASQLAAADKFARGMQHALVLAVSLKLSMDMSLHNPKKYQEIMERPGEAEAAAVAMADEDRRRKDFHDRAQFESAARVKAYKETLAKYQAKAKAEKIASSAVLMEEDRLAKLIEAAMYKEEETEAVYRGQLAEREAKRDDDSDLEELEEEERWVAEQERINDELEEAADRLEELREKEEEEAEAAREAAGLNVEEEEEEEEVEGVTDEAAVFDSELAEAAAKEKAEAEKEEEKARLAALRAPVKKKTKAELMAEKAAADEVLLMDALAVSYEQGMELALDDNIEVICLEHIFQADLDELMQRRPRQTDQEALEESTLQMARLAAEKVAVRRGLGRRVVFLSS